ncbi:Zinc finger, RING-type [Sesbania bispinosa]|nr:Zinc finger, RING-type [Sesbania bispinosa]
MGLSNFPCSAEGVLPVLVMNTVLSVALLKNMFRSMLQVIGGSYYSPPSSDESHIDEIESCSRERRVSISQYKSLCHSIGRKMVMVECCVCLCGFEANQEVSELPCKHFFHRGCLDKWFDNKHTTCPLCRSKD